MSNSEVVVEKRTGIIRVTIHEKGKWSLLMNDIDGACTHVWCVGPMSYYLYYDDDGFAYSIRPPTDLSLTNAKNRCWLSSKNTIKMYKFGHIEIESKKFNSVYQIQEDVDCERIRISEGVVANKHDTRYTIGYEVEPDVIVPFFVKTPKDCLSSGVSRYNDTSPWKIGFNVGWDEAFLKAYEAIWKTIEKCLLKTLEGKPLSNEKYINPKLITWDNEIRTRFRGNYPGFIENIGACYASGVLKIGSVYQQRSNHFLQVFLKECKYLKRDVSFESLLSDDESDDSGHDTVNWVIRDICEEAIFTNFHRRVVINESSMHAFARGIL